jgi:hypothetical protein
MFTYGEKNHSLSYLGSSADDDIELAERPHSVELPRYPNAPEIRSRITNSVSRGSSICRAAPSPTAHTQPPRLESAALDAA